MSNAGKNVKVHYTGTLKDGSKFDSSLDRGQPLAFTCMKGQMIPGFDNAVDGMAVGEKKTVEIPAAEAYGERNDELIMQMPIENVPNPSELVVGDMVQLSGPGGRPTPARIHEVTDKYVALDLNHELAGQDLIFEIELISTD